MKIRPVICNDCGHEFKIKKILKKIHNDGAEGRIEIEYFSCPKCKKKYVKDIYNNKLKNMIKEIRQVRNAYDKEKDPLKAEELFKKFEKMRKDNIRLSEHLKFFFSKYV